jgi:hypothetical protein
METESSDARRWRLSELGLQWIALGGADRAAAALVGQQWMSTALGWIDSGGGLVITKLTAELCSLKLDPWSSLPSFFHSFFSELFFLLLFPSFLLSFLYSFRFCFLAED